MLLFKWRVFVGENIYTPERDLRT